MIAYQKVRYEPRKPCLTGRCGSPNGYKWPVMISPFASWLHGVSDAGGYKFMRAFFGLFASGVIGVVISLLTKPKPESEIAGLWVGSTNWGRRFFKGGEPNFEIGDKIMAALRVSDDDTAEMTHPPIPVPEAPPGQPVPRYPIVRLCRQDMVRMKAREGDLLYVADARRYLGGLRSLHVKAGRPHDQGNIVLIANEAFRAGNFVAGRPARVEKFF